MVKWQTKLSALLIIACATGSFAEPTPPKLILQITVDQLRGDMPSWYLDRMGEGGFRYLLEQGVVFKDAHHAANVWFDRESGKLTYNIEDARYHILSAGADIDEATEVDTTQKLASTDGRSPANIMVSTFGDELFLRSNGKAKIFGVSVKDRGAVTLAGHVGKAFWFSKATGEFITSSYYYDEYPEWVNAWNDQTFRES